MDKVRDFPAWDVLFLHLFLLTVKGDKLLISIIVRYRQMQFPCLFLDSVFQCFLHRKRLS